MSHSSVEVTYRPEGAGQKPRRATFDLAIIPEAEVWLTARLGALATCELRQSTTTAQHPEPEPAVRLAVRSLVMADEPAGPGTEIHPQRPMEAIS